MPFFDDPTPQHTNPLARLLRSNSFGPRFTDQFKESPMCQPGRRVRLISTICAAVLSLTTLTAQQEFSSAAKPRGKAVVEYRD